MDKKRLLEIAEELDIKIEFNTDKPGVYNENTGSFFTFEELLGDILPSDRTIDKVRINKVNKILLNSYNRNSTVSENIEYSTGEDVYKTKNKKYKTLSKVYKWVA